jgi:hypothetical protein
LRFECSCKGTLYCRRDRVRNIKFFFFLKKKKKANADICVLSIIAVPGLAADPRRSFDSFKQKADGTTQFNWLRDKEGIRKSIENSRIMTFYYESEWKGSTAVQQSISNVALTLLESLKEHRKASPTRPVIFLGHSMGGLVVAKAITMASIRADDYPNLFQCFAGSMFFGTPFEGSQALNKDSLMVNILASKDVGKTRALTFLDPNNEGLEELVNEFRRVNDKMDARIQICCFYEQKPLDFAKAQFKIPFKPLAEIVVTQRSASLQGVESVGLPLDHRELNRYNSPKDGNYEQVRSRLNTMAKKSASLVKRRINATRSSVMDDATVTRLVGDLSPRNMHEKKVDVAASGASTWILDDEAFKSWVQIANGAPSRAFWIYGQQGRGKSKCSISVIDELERRELNAKDHASSSNIVVAYFFADSTPDLSNAESILRSILAQLISKRRSLALYAKEFVSDGRRKGPGSESQSGYTIKNLWRILMDMLKDPGIDGAYFIINSLHEFPEDTDSTKEFLNLIQLSILGEDPTSPHSYEDPDTKTAPMRWMFTSRSRDNIKDILGVRPDVIKIDIDDPKYGTLLQQDYKDHARRRVAEVAKRKGYSPALKYFATSLVEKKAENSVWIDVICRKLELLPANTVAVRRALETVVQGVENLIDSTWTSVSRLSGPFLFCL